MCSIQLAKVFILSFLPLICIACARYRITRKPCKFQQEMIHEYDNGKASTWADVSANINIGVKEIDPADAGSVEIMDYWESNEPGSVKDTFKIDSEDLQRSLREYVLKSLILSDRISELSIWERASANTWDEQTTLVRNILVPPGSKLSIWQRVAQCAMRLQIRNSEIQKNITAQSQDQPVKNNKTYWTLEVKHRKSIHVRPESDQRLGSDDSKDNSQLPTLFIIFISVGVTLTLIGIIYGLFYCFRRMSGKSIKSVPKISEQENLRTPCPNSQF